MRVVALGVGDTALGDEGVGVLAAGMLNGKVPPDVEVLIPGTVDNRWVVELEGTSHLLVLDCVDVGRAPGTMVVFDSRELRPCSMSVAVHEFGVADLLVLLGQRFDAPEQIVILGMQQGSVEPGTGLSEPVAATLPEFVAQATRVLRAWMGVGPSDPPSEGQEAHPIDC